MFPDCSCDLQEAAKLEEILQHWLAQATNEIMGNLQVSSQVTFHHIVFQPKRIVYSAEYSNKWAGRSKCSPTATYVITNSFSGFLWSLMLPQLNFSAHNWDHFHETKRRVDMGVGENQFWLCTKPACAHIDCGGNEIAEMVGWIVPHQTPGITCFCSSLHDTCTWTISTICKGLNETLTGSFYVIALKMWHNRQPVT